jgi:hypothetical protein
MVKREEHALKDQSGIEGKELVSEMVKREEQLFKD